MQCRVDLDFLLQIFPGAWFLLLMTSKRSLNDIWSSRVIPLGMLFAKQREEMHPTRLQ
jgi:hypothetical protein